MHAKVRNGCADHGQVGRSCHDRALLEVEVEGRLDRLLQGTGAQEQVRDRPISVSGQSLGPIHLLVQPKRPPRGLRKSLQDEVERSRRAQRIAQHAGHCDGARVDHRIVGAPRDRAELDGIERVAARLDADAGEDLIAATQLERHAVAQRLGGGLDRELEVGIANGVHPAFGGGHGYAKRVRRNVCELGNVVGECAILQGRSARIDVGQYVVDMRTGQALTCDLASR